MNSAGMAGGPVWVAGRWEVDRWGAVEAAWPDGRPAFRLLKVKADGDRYVVSRTGRAEVYFRTP
jgi:hypothetical protein